MILISVAFAAVPDVFWFPPVLTPGRSMLAVPLNDTPPIFLAFSNWVADPALPDILPVNVALNVPLTVTLLNVDVPDPALTLPENVVAVAVPDK